METQYIVTLFNNIGKKHQGCILSPLKFDTVVVQEKWSINTKSKIKILIITENVYSTSINWVPLCQVLFVLGTKDTAVNKARLLSWN